MEESKRIEEEKEMARQKMAKALPDEPQEGAKDVMLIIFRLPDGERVQRRFLTTDKVDVSWVNSGLKAKLEKGLSFIALDYVVLLVYIHLPKGKCVICTNLLEKTEQEILC